MKDDGSAAFFFSLLFFSSFYFLLYFYRFLIVLSLSLSLFLFGVFRRRCFFCLFFFYLFVGPLAHPFLVVLLRVIFAARFVWPGPDIIRLDKSMADVVVNDVALPTRALLLAPQHRGETEERPRTYKRTLSST